MSQPTPELELATTAAETVEATGGLGMLGINLKIFIAQLVNFLVVLVVMWKWVYTPLVKLLDERSKRVETSVKQADEIEVRLKQVEIDQKRIIAEAQTDAASMLEQAKVQADERKKELLENAKAEVQKIVTQGKEQLRAEKVAMLKDAKAEMVDIAVEAAKAILKDAVNEKKSRELAEDLVKKMV